MEPNRKWLALPKDKRNQLINNVFCKRCMDAVTITDFIIVESPHGIMLDGKCKNCGSDVARVVEMEG